MLLRSVHEHSDALTEAIVAMLVRDAVCELNAMEPPKPAKPAAIARTHHVSQTNMKYQLLDRIDQFQREAVRVTCCMHPPVTCDM